VLLAAAAAAAELAAAAAVCGVCICAALLREIVDFEGERDIRNFVIYTHHIPNNNRNKKEKILIHSYL
jgi:hypothetical protein